MPIRIKAFLYHLIGSLILAACAVALVFLIWYPAPFAQAAGVTRIFLLMLCIDVIVGPLFTLLVYKVGKKTLTLDLAVIIIVQLIMFSYGIHTVAAGRPVWLVFSVDQFYALRAADVSSHITKTTPPDYRHAPWLGPQWVTAHLPEDKKLRRQLVIETLDSGRGLFMNPDLYRPLAYDTAIIRSKAHPLAELQQYNSPEVVKSTLVQWSTASTWLPLWSTPRSMTVLLDRNNNVVTITNLNPWRQ